MSARPGSAGSATDDVVPEVGLAQRDREPVARALLGERGDRLFLRHLAAQVDDFEIELVRERAGEITLVEDAGVDEVLAETLPGLGLALERGAELLPR